MLIGERPGWWNTPPVEHPELDPDIYRDTLKYLATRWSAVMGIARDAWLKGLDVTPDMIDKDLRVWRNWSSGALATGYVRKLTGVKFRSESRLLTKE